MFSFTEKENTKDFKLQWQWPECSSGGGDWPQLLDWKGPGGTVGLGCLVTLQRKPERGGLLLDPFVIRLGLGESCRVNKDRVEGWTRWKLTQQTMRRRLNNLWTLEVQNYQRWHHSMNFWLNWSKKGRCGKLWSVRDKKTAELEQKVDFLEQYKRRFVNYWTWN